jgi:acyl carrier protein
MMPASMKHIDQDTYKGQQMNAIATGAQDIKAATRQFIIDNFLMGAPETDLRDDDSFIARHLVDSTGFLELVMHLEQTYGIAVADEELIPENLDSLEAIARFIGRKMAQPA